MMMMDGVVDCCCCCVALFLPVFPRPLLHFFLAGADGSSVGAAPGTRMVNSSAAAAVVVDIGVVVSLRDVDDLRDGRWTMMNEGTGMTIVAGINQASASP